MISRSCPRTKFTTEEGNSNVQEQKNGRSPAHHCHSHQYDGLRHHPFAGKFSRNRHYFHFRMDLGLYGRNDLGVCVFRLRHARQKSRRHGRICGISLRKARKFPLKLHLCDFSYRRQYRHRDRRRFLRLVLPRAFALAAHGVLSHDRRLGACRLDQFRRPQKSRTLFDFRCHVRHDTCLGTPGLRLDEL